MKKNLVKSALVGALVVFIWGAISWMVLPWHAKSLLRFDDESRVASVIMNNASESGVYVLPNMCGFNQSTSKDEMKSAKKMMENGPIVFASVRLEGMNKMSPLPFIRGFIFQFLAALIVTWMLMQTKGLSFRAQVGFVTLFGVGAGLLCVLSDWNWWGFSACYTSAMLLDLVIGWFLAGLAITKLCKHR